MPLTQQFRPGEELGSKLSVLRLLTGYLPYVRAGRHSIEMAKLMNRSRGLAEGVVVMICPVLLALVVNIIDLNSEVYGHGVPIPLIVIAGITLITGICPLLVCCFSEGFLHKNESSSRVTMMLATLSSCCLVILACLIAQFIISKSIFITFGVIFGIIVLVQAFPYVYDKRNEHDGQVYTIEMHRVLDESHEFLTSVTGIIFLGFEGLALDGHGGTMGLEPVGCISFVFCVLGVCSMFLEMAPPTCFVVSNERSEEGKKKIEHFTLILECIMAVSVFVLLLVVMCKLTQPIVAMWVILPLIVCLGQFLFLGMFSEDTQEDQESRPASLELTKVTFTGFLAVSVTNISEASPTKLTRYFLLLSSLAIGFGLSWRLLSQNNTKSGLKGCVTPAHVSSAAKLASFCAHLCIVIATILFIAMAITANGK
ncbi:hypothetical protein ACQJBY_073576 [Aegilops geniculata]